MIYILLLMLSLPCFYSLEQKDGVKFHDISNEKALNIAAKEKKMIFIDFYTTWCGPCKMMTSNVFPTKIAGDYFNPRFVSLKIDAEKGEGKILAKEFVVDGYPTFIVLDDKGKELYRTKGYQDVENFVDRIRIGLDPKWTPEQVERRYNKGERTPSLVNEYIYQQMLAGNEKQGYQAADIYFNKLSNKKRLKSENFFLYKRYTRNLDDLKGKYMFDNYAQFVKSEKGNETRDLMSSWFRFKLIPYATLKSLNPITKIGFDSIKIAAHTIGMDTVGGIREMLNIGEARVSDNMEAYLTACSEQLPTMLPRDHFSVLQSMDELNNQSDDIKQIAASLINVYLDKQRGISQRILRAKMWSLQKKKEYNLNVLMDGVTDGKVVLMGTKLSATDTFQFTNGRLSIFLGSKDTSRISLRFICDELAAPTKELGNNYPTGSLLMVPGEYITIKATLAKGKVPQYEWVRGNAPITKDYITYHYEMPLPDQKTYNQLIIDNIIAGGDIRNYKKEYEAYAKSTNTTVKRFIQEYPQSYMTATLLLEHYNLFDENEIDTIVSKFSESLKTTQYAKVLIRKLNAGKAFRTGTIASDFTKKDIKGHNVSLGNWKGKYVLIDFWGSWCGPCRNSHPHLKELHKRYGKEVVFVNVANENNQDLNEAKKIWKQAVKEDGLNWTQILNNEDRQKFDLIRLYNITSFPTKILIGPDGKIVSRMVGASADPEPLFKQLFN